MVRTLTERKQSAVSREVHAVRSRERLIRWRSAQSIEPAGVLFVNPGKTTRYNLL
jgi:hypothetical protein